MAKKYDSVDGKPNENYLLTQLTCNQKFKN